MTTKKEMLTEVIFVRVSPPMKRDIVLSAESEGMEIAAWCRTAIEKKLGIKTPSHCACGKHWGHRGKHSQVKY